MTASQSAPGRWAKLVAPAALSLVVATLAAPGRAAPPPPTLIEGDLPALRDVLGAAGGRPTLVNLWATWCAPCVHEIPLLNGLEERLAPQGVRFLAGSLDPFVFQDVSEARGKVARLVAEKGFRLPVFLYLGGQESLSQMYDLPPVCPTRCCSAPMARCWSGWRGNSSRRR